MKNLTVCWPDYIKKILLLLEANDHQAYVVGGAVRDLLLKVPPGDFDIATDAEPSETVEILAGAGYRTIDALGQNYGVVVALVDGQPVEIATFRSEIYGKDAHRPEEVWYCKKLEEDLERRDFTVNAMALDLRGTLYDYHQGVLDLQQKVIKTVGKAQTRYQEDALRMFRACRFVAQLDFSYQQEEDVLPPFGEPNTPYYLNKNFKFPVEGAKGLSIERVRTEIDKMLVSPSAGKGLMLFLSTGLARPSCRIRKQGTEQSVDILPELEHLVALRQNTRFHCYNVWEHTLAAIDNSRPDLILRWALLLHDIGKGLPNVRKINHEGQPNDHGHEAVSAVMARTILERLNYPESFIKRVTWLIARHMRFAPMLMTGERTLLHWLRTEVNSGYFRDNAELTEAFGQLVEVFLADMGATHAGKNEKLMTEGKALGEAILKLAKQRMPVHTSDLNINGREVLALLDNKMDITVVMQYLLQRVRNGDLINEYPNLRQAVLGWKKRYRRNEQK